jgi:cell division transport system ATP-binding protein
MIPVVGQSRRLKDASGRDPGPEPAAASPGGYARAQTRAEARAAAEGTL